MAEHESEKSEQGAHPLGTGSLFGINANPTQPFARREQPRHPGRALLITLGAAVVLIGAIVAFTYWI